MDIRAWEGRASALDGTTYRPEHGYQEEEVHYDESGEIMTLAEYEELLFRRVLDKIRIARAAGSADVQLSPEELDAYQSRMYGTRAPAARPQPQSRPSSASIPNDAASIVSVNATTKAGSSSRSKKSQQRSSLFSSKPKKEKPSSRKQTSNMPLAESHAPPPGFVVPGPDGQPMYAPINAYQGSLFREPDHLHPDSRSASDTSHHNPSPPRVSPPRDMLGAFPGSEYAYRPSTPPRQGRPVSARQAAYERDLPPVSRTRSSSIQSARLIPFPVEPYQYHAFSPPSSSSPTSPPPQYARRVSTAPSEASYTSMPRRVPVPVPAPAPVPLQRTTTGLGIQGGRSDPVLATQASGFTVPTQSQETTKATGSGERKRKGGKSKKKT
ncbi:hypothetical protein BDW02DRAFT_488487 [Decorospora gaudefroyi]|uniref:Uncharacterized protein n=1 Tax=Decorospora gaudefroyi TaxID=184978 RepID=A0A6A5KTG4_9PLEO|nr:hypothetical protein BDW02DRAFT_488487 [Decorospora gaudefroyi]